MTENIFNIESISDMNKMLGIDTLHPLVSVIDFSKQRPSDIGEITFTANLYAIMIKDSFCGDLKYGRNKYDYQEETMVFFAPRQVVGVEASENSSEGKGIGVIFHPDLLRGTALASDIKQYNFFSYEVSEALHLSTSERATIGDCIAKLQEEVARPIDKHSKHIIVSGIELLLKYCERFYDRQFITREQINNDVLSQFESLLDNYFENKTAAQNGLPTVKQFAETLNLSPNYFGDLIKKETGHSAQEHIQLQVMEQAKNKLANTNLSVSEIAYSLGFEYPQYFSRQFKKRVGSTPNQFRASC